MLELSKRLYSSIISTVKQYNNEKDILELMKPYQQQINRLCKYKTKKSYWEMISIGGIGLDFNKQAEEDWVYRIPVTCLQRGFKISHETFADGYEKNLIPRFTKECCDKLMSYFKTNKEDGYEFVLRQNIVLECFREPFTLDKIYSFYLRVTKVPESPETIKKVINQGHKYTNDFLGMQRGEGKLLSIENI